MFNKLQNALNTEEYTEVIYASANCMAFLLSKCSQTIMWNAKNVSKWNNACKTAGGLGIQLCYGILTAINLRKCIMFLAYNARKLLLLYVVMKRNISSSWNMVLLRWFIK